MTGSTRRDRSLADIRLRTILTSWHQNSRYRSAALTLRRSQPVKGVLWLQIRRSRLNDSARKGLRPSRALAENGRRLYSSG